MTEKIALTAKFVFQLKLMQSQTKPNESNPSSRPEPSVTSPKRYAGFKSSRPTPENTTSTRNLFALRDDVATATGVETTDFLSPSTPPPPKQDKALDKFASVIQAEMSVVPMLSPMSSTPKHSSASSVTQSSAGSETEIPPAKLPQMSSSPQKLQLQPELLVSPEQLPQSATRKHSSASSVLLLSSSESESDISLVKMSRTPASPRKLQAEAVMPVTSEQLQLPPAKVKSLSTSFAVEMSSHEAKELQPGLQTKELQEQQQPTPEVQSVSGEPNELQLGCSETGLTTQAKVGKTEPIAGLKRNLQASEMEQVARSRPEFQPSTSQTVAADTSSQPPKKKKGRVNFLFKLGKSFARPKRSPNVAFHLKNRTSLTGHMFCPLSSQRIGNNV